MVNSKGKKGGDKPPKAHKQDKVWRAEMNVVEKDVVVTDPCYFIKDDLWSEFCSREFGDAQVRPKMVLQDGVWMLLASTLYGDWMCELHGRHEGRRHLFGTFTADSGLVCVATFSSPELRTAVEKLPKHCWTVIPQFTGTLSISHVARKCTVRGHGRSNGRDVEFNSIQVG
jgi:hypothetical protein